MAGQVSEIAGGATVAALPAAETDADRPLPAGTVIDGRYRLMAELGAGGMGRVYEAEHMFIRRRMALKLLRTGHAASDAAARMIQEATLAGQVPHPAVVRVFDCAALGDGQVYLAMELLRGESLEQALRRPGNAVEMVRRLIEVARGLAAVHRVGVVHRDIKPANIFLALGEQGVHAKLLDFGIAKLLPGAAGVGDDSVRTRAGAVLGTPYYLAPEQARGGAIDGRADLYSLGVILYEALTGGLPFVGESFMEILAQHIKVPPLDPRQAAPGRAIPDGIARLTMRLLAKDPGQRTGDGDALADELEGLMRTEGEALARLTVGVREGPVASAEAGTFVMAEVGTVRLSSLSSLSSLSEGTDGAVGLQGGGDLSEGAGSTAPRVPARAGVAALGVAARVAARVAAVIASVVIGWVAVRPAAQGPVDRTGGTPSRVVPAVTLPALVPGPAAVASAPAVVPAVEAPAQVAGTPPPQPVVGPRHPDKKRPRDGGTRRDARPPRTGGEAPKTDPREPQLKPDVYDE